MNAVLDPAAIDCFAAPIKGQNAFSISKAFFDNLYPEICNNIAMIGFDLYQSCILYSEKPAVIKLKVSRNGHKFEFLFISFATCLLKKAS
jgi:hypothetical protein